jgi:hypothetical protein
MPRAYSGRKLLIVNPDVFRAKIQGAKLIKRLQNHALGKEEMQISQVRAAVALLNKICPDLVSQEIKASIEHRYVLEVPPVSLSSAEWESEPIQPTIEQANGTKLAPTIGAEAENGEVSKH